MDKGSPCVTPSLLYKNVDEPLIIIIIIIIIIMIIIIINNNNGYVIIMLYSAHMQ